MNNDTTSFVVQGKDPANPKKRKVLLTRAPALEDIVKNSCNRKMEKNRLIGAWFNPIMHKFICEEGNNVMVFNMLFKNVIIRWDKDFKRARQLHGWSANPE